MRKLFFSFLLALVVPMVAGAQEKEMYAVYDEDAKTFTFYYDKYRDKRDGKVYDLARKGAGGNSKWGTLWNNADWMKTVTKTVFDASFADARPTNTSLWFYEFQNMTQIEGIEYLNTSEVTDMEGMFIGCESLTTLDVSHFDTGNVTDMGGMFCRCRSLTSLDVSHFDTGNVTYMNCMFMSCELLTTLDVSHFDTGNVTDMVSMFHCCFALTALDVSHFNTSKVTDMLQMFSDCRSLTSLDVSHFDTRNVTNMSIMFCDCRSLTALDVSHFDTGNVKAMGSMFYGCSLLTTLDVSHFDTRKVETMNYMFDDCTSLTTIYCNDDWNEIGRKYDGMSSECMFQNCTSLVGGAGTLFDHNTSNDATMAHPDSADNPGYFTRKAGGSGEWAKGDLNHDGKVDAADVSVLVALMMNPGSDSLDEGDLNHDGNVDAADVVWLVNHILNKE